jgi:hypothetical protein
MPKIEKPFEFEIPLNSIENINLRNAVINHGSIYISGIGYDYGSQPDNEERYSCDVDSITFKGSEMIQVFKHFQPMESAFDHIKEIAFEHVKGFVFDPEIIKDEQTDFNESSWHKLTT